jgi:metal-responsive CopG/Arc/MetJ family transcriptional regulator
MAAMRTQIYLTKEQRERLDALARRDERSLAELIREAVDDYLEQAAPNPARALRSTFGIAPDFEVPSRDEWDERERRLWGA